MRSTSFVVLSVLLHIAVVLAIALHPTRIVSDLVAGEKIEVNMGAEAEKAGAPDAPEKMEPSKPQEIAKPAAPAPVAQKPIAKVEKKSKPAAPAASKVAAAPIAAAVTEESTQTEVVKEAAPEVIPVIETASAAVEASHEAPAVEESVKETVTKPVPVAASAPAAAPAEKTPAPPAPVTEPPAAAASSAPIGVVTTATGTSSKEQETGELAKGGDSKEGAVAVADLKQLAGNKPPRYPMKARLEGRQGETELVYRVTSDGKVADVSVDKSSGSKDLDAEAVKAISNYRFVPGQEGWARHPVAFSLKGIATSTPARLRTKSGAQANAE